MPCVLSRNAAGGCAAHSGQAAGGGRDVARQAAPRAPPAGDVPSSMWPRVRAHVTMGPDSSLEVALGKQPGLRQALQQCAR